MITCIYDYISKNKCIKCMILMHEITCYHPSRAFKDFDAIDFTDDQDIDACVEEVMMIDKEARFKELPMDEPTLELKKLPSTLKYAFLDEEKAKPVIISSKLDIKQEKELLDVLNRQKMHPVSP